MARKVKDKKDRTSVVISLIFHGVLLAGIAYWAHKSGKLEELTRRILQLAQTEKKSEKKLDSAPIQNKPTPAQLPPINQGFTAPSSGGGMRRAVAADAPPAAEGAFFQDTRQQGPEDRDAQTGTTGGSPQTPKFTTARAPTLMTAPPLLKVSGATTIKALLAERSQAAATIDSFGAEQIAKTGVSDAGDIVTKVAGASVVGGKFAVIRGLSDRYISTTLNGAEIPSPDPYRKSAAMDLFPSQIIDKVVIAKTFTPDQPGTYTGGGINIVTKSFPTKPFLAMSVGGAYNTQSTGNKNYLSYPGGSTDWLGLDDGTRALPPELSAEDLKVPLAPSISGKPTAKNYEQNVANADQVNSLSQAMGTTDFAPKSGEGPLPNHNFSLAGGESAFLFGRPLGYFAGLNYNRGYSFYDEGIRRKYAYHADEEPTLKKDYEDTRSVDEVNWAGIVSVGYQLWENHELGFNFLYNQSSENTARIQSGYNETDPNATFYSDQLHWIQRHLNTLQLHGTHSLPEDMSNTRLDWLASFSNTSQEEPDTRFFNYLDNGEEYEIKSGVDSPTSPTRYFRDLEEDNRNLKADLTVPFRQWNWQPAELKLGLFDSQSERTFFDREIYYPPQPILDFAENGDPNQFLTEENLGYFPTTNKNGSITYNWQRYVQSRDSQYEGDQNIFAGYLMLDMPLAEKFRLVGGARYEVTDLSVDSRSYLANSITGKTTNSSQLDQNDLLPAAGLVYALRTNMNVRLSYSQTIARPSFRELAGYRSYDPTLDEQVDGNPELEMSAIENFDARWEWFPKPGELLGVSLFYKKIDQAIERAFVTIDGDVISYVNRPEASVYGVEFEARKNLGFIDLNLRRFSLGGNFSFMSSSVELSADEYKVKKNYVPDVSDTRPLYDQSPYLVNLDFTYDNQERGTTAGLVFNMIGPRITIAGISTEDIYEQPAMSLDFLISQRIGRFLKFKFSLKNILDPPIERTYGKDSDLLYSSYRKGRTFGLSLSYEF